MLVDKPGLPFVADMQFEESNGRPIPLDNPAYRAGMSRDNLISRTAIAIAAARRVWGWVMEPSYGAGSWSLLRSDLYVMRGIPQIPYPSIT